MHFTKPEWVMHRDSSKDTNAKRQSIFSVHVHPDGSRIATGGLDAKIRIWSTKPILNPASEASGKPPKSLCTLTMHTGPVLVVRWAHNGRWLASGSDDEIVVIWDLDPRGGGKVWGSDEVNVEGWKPLKRLTGHESDVTDVAWSPQDRYLASVGLDSKVIIWDGYTLEQVRKLEQHQGFVKGVCWDPVGEFLATQSDDRSVKIWRTSNWTLEHSVTKPFEDSPSSTFFRRLSWSPDGAHITASNATNNKGFVFIAAVISRNSWTSDISLVGHENTVEVACYNPHIFLRTPNTTKVTAQNVCSVVALGADDRSVSVWQTKSARPLIVAKQVFDRQIMDLSWSWDGLTLYAASSDGTIAVFHFTPDELEGIAPHSVQEEYLAKFEYKIPAPPPHVQPDAQLTHYAPPPPQTLDLPKAIVGGEQVNQLVARRGGKKRATLVSSSGPLSSAQPNGIMTAPASKRTIPSSQVPESRAFASSSRLGDDHGFGGAFEKAFDGTRPWSTARQLDASASMDVDVPIDAYDGDVGKGGPVIDLTDEDKPKGRTIGGDRKVENPPVSKRLSSWGDGAQSSAQTAASSSSAPLLPPPPLLSYISAELEHNKVLEARNDEEKRTTEVSFVAANNVQWLDYLPSPVIALAVTSKFSAVASQDGCINVYSPAGRRLMNPLAVGSQIAFLEAKEDHLLAITTTTQVYCWNVQKSKSAFPPQPLSPILLSTSPPSTVTSALLSQNGVPIIQVSNGATYSYDPNLSSFFKLTERWWAENSDAFTGRVRAPQSTRGLMSTTESALKDYLEKTGMLEDTSGIARPTWWNTAITLGHMETRMHSLKLLEGSTEYRQVVLVYARKIADEGLRSKAEELIKELYGPMYWRPGREEGSVSSTICGIPRKDLVKDVLSIFARSKTLTKLGQEWQDMLRKAWIDELS